jgi:hypothetical protein
MELSREIIVYVAMELIIVMALATLAPWDVPYVQVQASVVHALADII